VALDSFRQLVSETNSTGSPKAKPPDGVAAAAAAADAGDAMGAGARAGLETAPGAGAGARTSNDQHGARFKAAKKGKPNFMVQGHAACHTPDSKT